MYDSSLENRQFLYNIVGISKLDKVGVAWIVKKSRDGVVPYYCMVVVPCHYILVVPVTQGKPFIFGL